MLLGRSCYAGARIRRAPIDVDAMGRLIRGVEEPDQEFNALVQGVVGHVSDLIGDAVALRLINAHSAAESRDEEIVTGRGVRSRSTGRSSRPGVL